MERVMIFTVQCTQIGGLRFRLNHLIPCMLDVPYPPRKHYITVTRVPLLWITELSDTDGREMLIGRRMPGTAIRRETVTIANVENLNRIHLIIVLQADASEMPSYDIRPLRN